MVSAIHSSVSPVTHELPTALAARPRTNLVDPLKVLLQRWSMMDAEGAIIVLQVDGSGSVIIRRHGTTSDQYMISAEDVQSIMLKLEHMKNINTDQSVKQIKTFDSRMNLGRIAIVKSNPLKIIRLSLAN